MFPNELCTKKSQTVMCEERVLFLNGNYENNYRKSLSIFTDV